MTKEQILKILQIKYDRLPKLPCRIDEMTEREHKILRTFAELTGAVKWILENPDEEIDL